MDIEWFRDLLDKKTRTMSRDDYRKVLDEIASEVECREMALADDERQLETE